MSEKKIVVYDLRLSYNGPVDIPGFYKEIDRWMEEKGMEKEIKKKMEHVTSKGKEIEYIVEAWKDVHHNYKDVVSLRALFHHVKEVDLKINKRKKRMQQADILLIFNGILETHLHTQWEMNPLFYFFRALFDKYVWKFHTEKYFGVVYSDTHDLHKRLKAYLSLGKYDLVHKNIP